MRDSLKKIATLPRAMQAVFREILSDEELSLHEKELLVVDRLKKFDFEVIEKGVNG